MIQTDNDNAMDASLFKSGTQTQKDLDDLVWTQTQETSELDIDKIKIQVSKIRYDQNSDFLEIQQNIFLIISCLQDIYRLY